MKKTISAFFFAAAMLYGFLAHAQPLRGKVEQTFEGKNIGLPNASVYWAGTTNGTIADLDGAFKLERPEKWPATLVASYLGYINDSITFEYHPGKEIEFTLKSVALEGTEFEVIGERNGTDISTMDPIITEYIGEKELTKAACCNLSESFETNASVDVVVADAVSGTKKLRMLGLDGIYTQMQQENIPTIRGLSAATGLTQVPGTWVKSIQINKGAGSVVNGHESITGQINVEYQKPDADRLMVNGYGNSAGRAELNVQYAKQINETWGTNLLVHGSGAQLQNDRNKDGFLDLPIYNNVNVFSRWKRMGEKHRGQIMLRIVDETKQAGQTNYDYDRDFGNQDAYGIGLRTRQYEVYLKNGFLFEDRPQMSIGLMAKGNLYYLDTYYGNRSYKGEQRSAYVNAIFQNMFNTTAHVYKTGVSFRYDHFEESFVDSGFSREEIVPGAFFEYTFDNSDNFSMVAGLRGDYHNVYGAQFSPRFHMKYNPRPLMAFRVSGGSGFRTPNLYAENMGYLASSRRIVVQETPELEKAWNVGASITRKFGLFNEDAAFTIDFFSTHFTNQLVADVYATAREVRFYNLDGKSYSNALQAELAFEPIERLKVRTAYKYTDVRVQYEQGLEVKPLVPTHRGLFNIGYETENGIWQFDATTQFVGTSTLPYTGDNAADYQLPEKSKAYWTQHVQVTKQFRLFEVYVGVENAFDFRQENPILSSDDPFGLYFDASMIYAPINGRVIYGGFRYNLK